MSENINKQCQNNGFGKVIAAIVITALVLLLAGAISWAVYERNEKQLYTEKAEKLQKQMDDLAQKQIADIQQLQDVVKNMANDVVLANKASESDLVQQAINSLEITVAAKQTPDDSIKSKFRDK